MKQVRYEVQRVLQEAYNETFCDGHQLKGDVYDQIRDKVFNQGRNQIHNQHYTIRINLYKTILK
jgi:hypothetical protein